MNLPDTNFWLALSISTHVFHDAARRWLVQQTGIGSIHFCRSTEQSFLRLLTTENVMKPYGIPPMTNKSAWEFYQGLRSDRRFTFSAEPTEIESIWKSFAVRETASPKLWMDAYLAAFALASQFRLVTSDQGFKQFKGLDFLVFFEKH